MLSGGRTQHRVTNNSYRGDRRVITRKEFWAELLAFHHQHVAPLELPSEQIMWYMIRSGLYVPDDSWLVPPPGRGVDLDRANAFLECVRAPETVTLLDVATVFLEPTVNRTMLHMLRVEYGYEFGGEEGFDRCSATHRAIRNHRELLQQRLRAGEMVEDNTGIMPWDMPKGTVTHYGEPVLSWEQLQAMLRGRNAGTPPGFEVHVGINADVDQHEAVGEWGAVAAAPAAEVAGQGLVEAAVQHTDDLDSR